MYTFSVVPDMAVMRWLTIVVFTLMWFASTLLLPPIVTSSAERTGEGVCTCGCRRGAHESLGRGSHCRTCGRDVCPKLRLRK